MDDRSTLEELMPAWDRRERHSRWIPAEPVAVWDAIMRVRADDVPLTRALFWVRGGFRRAGPDPSIPLVDALPPRRLVARPPVELVHGIVMPFGWPADPGRMTQPADGPSFAAFAKPGWAKAAINFQLTPEGDGTRLWTETRVVASDDRTRWVFAVYWTLIRAGSGLIRREILWAADRNARRR